VNDVLQLKASGDALSKKTLISIFDASGKNVFTCEKYSIGSLTEIPVNNLAHGVYFLRISNNDSAAQNIKFIKR